MNPKKCRPVEWLFEERDQMQVVKTDLPEVLIVEPKLFGDQRGFFLETYQLGRYIEQGIVGSFVQDNLSRSSYGVLRGLHLQNPSTQGKLVSALRGRVLDVAVDVRLDGVAEQAGQRERAALFQSGAAVREGFFGNAAAARQSGKTALALSKGKEVEYGVAFAEALAGDTGAAQVMADDLEKSRAVGFTEHLIKPINVDRLQVTLREIAQKQAKH